MKVRCSPLILLSATAMLSACVDPDPFVSTFESIDRSTVVGDVTIGERCPISRELAQEIHGLPFGEGPMPIEPDSDPALLLVSVQVEAVGAPERSSFYDIPNAELSIGTMVSGAVLVFGDRMLEELEAPPLAGLTLPQTDGLDAEVREACPAVENLTGYRGVGLKGGLWTVVLDDEDACVTQTNSPDRLPVEVLTTCHPRAEADERLVWQAAE